MLATFLAGMGTSVNKNRFNDFVKTGTFLSEVILATVTGDRGNVRLPFASQIPVVRESSGMQTQWVNGFFHRQDVYPFILPEKWKGMLAVHSKAC